MCVSSQTSIISANFQRLSKVLKKFSPLHAIMPIYQDVFWEGLPADVFHLASNIENWINFPMQNTHCRTAFLQNSSSGALISTVIISPPLQLPCRKGQPLVQMFSLINILNCLPPLIFVLKHICMRLTILTGSKNNHKIKVAETL